MKQLLVILASVAVISTGCNKTTTPAAVPGCIQSVINAQKNNPEWEVGSVDEYNFQGMIVYAFEPDNRIIADGVTVIKRTNCTELCQVGGFGGPDITLCNGDKFYGNAVLIRNLWKKR